MEVWLEEWRQILRHPISELRDGWGDDPMGLLAGLFLLVLFGAIALFVVVAVIALLVVFIVGVV